MTLEEIAHVLEEASIEVSHHYESRVIYPMGTMDSPQMIEHFSYSFCVDDLKLDVNDDGLCEIINVNQHRLFDGRLYWPAQGEDYTTLDYLQHDYRLTLNEAIQWLRRMRT